MKPACLACLLLLVSGSVFAQSPTPGAGPAAPFGSAERTMAPAMPDSGPPPNPVPQVGGGSPLNAAVSPTALGRESRPAPTIGNTNLPNGKATAPRPPVGASVAPR
ncbi:MAG TPA: hypothetical protein VL899_02415 [Alphaproteobacteria bacterium]|jgi:hypothetical protein|nr:hypothetical protein [Alphaproteobacteria bacterium]